MMFRLFTVNGSLRGSARPGKLRRLKLSFRTYLSSKTRRKLLGFARRGDAAKAPDAEPFGQEHFEPIQSKWTDAEKMKVSPSTPSTTAASTPSTSALTSPGADAMDTPMSTSTDESVKIEEVSADLLIRGLDVILRQRLDATRLVSGACQETTPFHATRAPKISIKDYLRRIHDYLYAGAVGDESFVMGLVYMHRSTTIWCDLNVHRMLFVAIMIAAKFHSDVPYKNSYYAKVAGLTLSELNDLEAQFLKIIDWETFVTPEEYQLYSDCVRKAASHTPVNPAGWS